MTNETIINLLYDLQNETHDNIKELQDKYNNLENTTEDYFSTLKYSIQELATPTFAYQDNYNNYNDLQKAFDETLNKQICKLIYDKLDKLNWTFKNVPYGDVTYPSCFISTITVNSIVLNVLVRQDALYIYREGVLLYSDYFLESENLYHILHNKLINLNKQDIINALKAL